MTDILFVFGTRPEAIKIGPIYAALKKQRIDVKVLCTGQHVSLLKGSPAESDLADAINCKLTSDGNVTKWLTRAQKVLAEQYDKLMPRLVVVQGDTMSALAGASQADLDGILLAHVEAGIRSHDLHNPWPEEATRVRIAELSEWHYAPTDQAFANLVAEGVRPERVRVLGNPIVTAINRYSDARFVPKPKKQIVVTLHRREIQQPGKVRELTEGVFAAALAAHKHVFIWPIHPAFQQYMKKNTPPSNVYLPGPLPYREFVQTLAYSKGLITDSGGAVEEAATLGVPTIILRELNDRVEAQRIGIAVRADPTYDNVLSGTLKLVMEEINRKATGIYGQPDSAYRIAAHLASLN